MTKKFFVVALLLLLTACEAGKFTPERNRLHEMGREGICEQNPKRCIDGVAW